MKRYALFAMAVIAASVLVPGVGFAQDAPTLESLAEASTGHKVLLDTLWVCVAAFLVFFMQAGFACVETGLTRSKNAINIIMKNIMDFSLGSVLFFAFGFALMFGDGNPFFGTSGFFMMGADNSPAVDAYQGVYSSISWAGVPLEAKFIFQLVFAATAATIVSGAMAERTKFKSYLIFSAIITGVLYPIVGHWIWGGGWLAELGMWDFAGSTVVHSTGGWLALVGAFMLGARRGKYGPDGKPRAIPGHSIPLAMLGMFILWLGWFGFNPGSTMAADTSIGLIALNTNLAAAMGAIAAMALSKVLFKYFDVSMTINGALAGLVAITAPCAFVSPVSAAIIGLLGGLAVVASVLAFDRVRIDDPVGAISVHGVCGALGTVCLGLFAQDAIAPGTTGDGLFFGGGTSLLVAQVIGVVSVLVYCLVTGFVVFGAIKMTVGLRVSEAEEEEGLDLTEHGFEAYPNMGIFGGSNQSPTPGASPVLAPATIKSTEPTTA